MKLRLPVGLRRLTDRYPRLSGPIRRQLLWLLRRLSAADDERQMAMSMRLGQLLVEDPCVRVTEFGGEFYLDARSALLRRLVSDGHYEPELTQLCARLCDPLRDVLDIGANVGFHAVLFGRLLTTGRVLAVEPTNNAVRRLHRNLERNAVKAKVIVHHGAASDQPGEVTIKTIAGQEEFSSLGDLVHPATANQAIQVERVQAITVDQLVAQYGLDPGFIKIDVEGAEHRVLAGACQTLRRCRPIIVAELSDPLLRANGSSAAALLEWLAELDYEVVDPLRETASPGSRPFGDILCTPRRTAQN